ncbi:MAG TPA: LysE family translocator [Longimicrobiaceae bacterium]|nr:LysE family translocator [Longimicrobiaceae bacterium]
MLDPQLLAFGGVAALLTVTPGSDTMLVIRNVLARGRRAGVLTTLGVCSALFLHALLSGLGISILVRDSAHGLELLRIAGGTFIVLLGVQTIVRAGWPGRSSHGMTGRPGGEGCAGGRWRSFSEGLVADALNPSTLIFYVAILPQFIRPGESALAKSMVLAGIHFVIGASWLLVVVFSSGALGRWITRSDTQRQAQLVIGAVLIGLGLHLALRSV